MKLTSQGSFVLRSQDLMLLQSNILEKKRHLKILKIVIYLIDFSIFNYKNNIQPNNADI